MGLCEPAYCFTTSNVDFHVFREVYFSIATVSLVVALADECELSFACLEDIAYA
jgi:hypothetical protein